MRLVHLTEVRVVRNWFGRTKVQTRRTGETEWSDEGTVPRGQTVVINCPAEITINHNHLWTVE